MVKLFTILAACFLYLVSTSAAYAHAVGQPPFFKVNGKYSPLYPVPTTSLTDFNLPQDSGPDNYLVNDPITFEIDYTQLGVPREIFDKTMFTWEMGDGGNASGPKVTYTYRRPGSYILKIDAQYESVIGSQLFQSTLVNILPRSDYKLPKAVIQVNNKVPKDPLVDVLKFPFGQELMFDAGQSAGGDSQIVEYFWDFGDGKSTTGQTAMHTYATDLPQEQVFPVLRVKTADGFISDAFAEIDDKSQSVSRVSEVSRVSRAKNFIIVGAVLIMAVVGGVLLLKGKEKK